MFCLSPTLVSVAVSLHVCLCLSLLLSPSLPSSLFIPASLAFSVNPSPPFPLLFSFFLHLWIPTMEPGWTSEVSQGLYHLADRHMWGL